MLANMLILEKSSGVASAELEGFHLRFAFQARHNTTVGINNELATPKDRLMFEA
jgi:hypothetical protein